MINSHHQSSDNELVEKEEEVVDDENFKIRPAIYKKEIMLFVNSAVPFQFGIQPCPDLISFLVHSSQ